MSTLDPGGKGGEILRAAATEAKDMDDDEVTNLATICWTVSALNSALASCWITTTTGEVGTLVRRALQAFPGSGLRAWQELNRWHRPAIALSRAKSICELQRFIMAWELRVAEHEGRHNEYVQEYVKVAALKRMMTEELAERFIEGSNTYPELRSRVAAYVGEKMIQQSHAPMDIGEVEGKVEGSDDQEAAKKKKKKRASVCYNCGGKEHPARLCPTPPGHVTPVVDERKATRMRSRRRRVMCAGSSGNVNSMVQATSTMTSWEWVGSPQNTASGSVSQLWRSRAQPKTPNLQASAVM